MATKEERLKALEQKQAQIKAQIQALKARDTAQERKDDTRRKVLISCWRRINSDIITKLDSRPHKAKTP